MIALIVFIGIAIFFALAACKAAAIADDQTERHIRELSESKPADAMSDHAE